MRFYKKLRNLATITTVSTICVYLINKLVFSLSSMKDALFSKYGNTYSWRFGSLYYTKHGTGSPLLLIHDLNNCSSELEFYKIKRRTLQVTYGLYFGSSGMRPFRQTADHLYKLSLCSADQ